MTLLAALRVKPGRFVSGAELAGEGGLSRAAIWKQIEDLRASGYVIEARPRLGYRLVSAPDLPYPDEIREGLETEIFGRPAVYLPTTVSTNDEAKRLGLEGWPEGTTVVAETQTAGRGRLGRHWSSSPGGLWFSIIAKPGLPLADLGPLTVAAAVALADAVGRRTGIKPAVKWPNDLVVGGRKLAGVLAEASGELGRADLVVLGIGLNVNQQREDFPAELAERATSLRILGGHEVPRVPLLRQFLQCFETQYLAGLKDAFRGAVAAAAANSDTLGRTVRLAVGRSFLEGNALRLDPDGALVVQTAAGEVRVLSGELTDP